MRMKWRSSLRMIMVWWRVRRWRRARCTEGAMVNEVVCTKQVRKRCGKDWRWGIGGRCVTATRGGVGGSHTCSHCRPSSSPHGTSTPCYLYSQFFCFVEPWSHMHQRHHTQRTGLTCGTLPPVHSHRNSPIWYEERKMLVRQELPVTIQVIYMS